MTSAFPDRTRLDRLLSHYTGVSRSRIRGMLKTWEVLVNGEPPEGPSQSVSSEDEVILDGETIDWPRFHYVMLHKPAGYVCTSEEGLHPSVIELVDAWWGRNLHSAGRLDVDTTGLVLLTDDGQWSHRVTSPRHDCVKVYEAVLAEAVSDADIAAFARGLQLREEHKPTLPAQLEVTGERQARVSLQEGRYHQVKRMFAACGNHVESLHRCSIGDIVLDESLAPGQWRELTPEETGQFA